MAPALCFGWPSLESRGPPRTARTPGKGGSRCPPPCALGSAPHGHPSTGRFVVVRSLYHSCKGTSCNSSPACVFSACLEQGPGVTPSAEAPQPPEPGRGERSNQTPGARRGAHGAPTLPAHLGNGLDPEPPGHARAPVAPAPRTPPPAPSCRARSAWVGVAPAGGGWRQRAFLSRMTPTLNQEHFHCRNGFKQRQDAASAARSRGYRKYPMAGAGRSVTERAAGGIMNWRCRDGAVGTR